MGRLKLRISWFLHIESNTPEIQLDHLESLTTPQDVLIFLIRRKFIGYLNYELIKVFQKATESDEMKGKIENYEEMCKVILQRFSFNTIREVCRRHPNFAPASYIGMPKRIQQGLSQLLSVSKGIGQKCCTANLYIHVHNVYRATVHVHRKIFNSKITVIKIKCSKIITDSFQLYIRMCYVCTDNANYISSL